MSVFSDPRIAAKVPAFLPAADEVWRLQRGGDAECRFFQRAVNGGELITDNGTRQGIYVMSPSGKVLSRVNSLKAERVLQMLEEGLAAWESLPEAERRLPEGLEFQGEERWEDSRPAGGLFLSRIVRDLPPSHALDGERATRWNRDSLWFSKGEVKHLLHAADQGVGDWRPVPRPFLRRIACFALVDNVFGQCIPFDEKDCEELRIEVRRVPVEGDAWQLEFRGQVRAVEDGVWRLGDNLWKPKRMHDHSMETLLHGSATFDPATLDCSAFELIALGRRTGFTELNSRRFRPEPGGIGFLVQLDHRAWSPAPTYIALYDADWVQVPKSGRELSKD